MKIKLGELCKIQAGGTPSRSNLEYWKNGNIPWVKISDINSKYLDVTTEFITEEGLRNSSTKLIRKGSLLYTIFATLGEVCITNIDVTTNQAIAGISLTNDIVDVDYLYYYLKSLKQYVNSIGRGVAQNNINLTLLRNFEIPIIDKKRQVLIADSLAKIEKIIDIKKNQLLEYDQLIKSRFVEMFGDIRSNSRALTSKSGKNLFKFSSGKFLSEDKRYNSGIPVYGGNGIAWYTDNPLIKHSTLIIGRVGAYCGNVQLVEEPVWITDNAIYIKEFYDDSFNLDFLFEMMKIIDFSRFADYSGQPKITQKPLEDMQYLVPKRQEQEDFSLFVKQVDKLKFAVQKSLDETQTLFDSLMQKYFG